MAAPISQEAAGIVPYVSRERNRRWKIWLRGLVIFCSLVGLVCTFIGIGFLSLTIWSATLFTLSIVWNMIHLASLGVINRFLRSCPSNVGLLFPRFVQQNLQWPKKMRIPRRPGWYVAFDLLLWLASAVTFGVTVSFAYGWEDKVAGVMSGCLLVSFLMHLTLFALACDDTKRRRDKHDDDSLKDQVQVKARAIISASRDYALRRRVSASTTGSLGTKPTEADSEQDRMISN